MSRNTISLAFRPHFQELSQHVAWPSRTDSAVATRKNQLTPNKQSNWLNGFNNKRNALQEHESLQ